MKFKKTLQPQDLRIGNWVATRNEIVNYSRVLDEKLYVEVCGLEKDCILVDLPQRESEQYPLRYDEIEPIQLTEELMRKCGFRFKEGYDLWYNDHAMLEAQLYDDGSTDSTSIWANSYMSRPCAHVRYLHELQNLYWAVTGEDLKVKL